MPNGTINGVVPPVRHRATTPLGEWCLLKLILPHKAPQKPNDSRTRWPYVSAIPPLGLADTTRFSQGSSRLATLGFGAESLWDSTLEFPKGIGPSLDRLFHRGAGAPDVRA